MSVLYRAVWTSALSVSPIELVELLKRRVAGWAHETDSPEPLTEGKDEFFASDDRHRTVSHRKLGSEAFEVIVSDERPDDPTVWTVLIRVVANTSLHVLVENHMDSDNLLQRVRVGRPIVVHELLAATDTPTLGTSRLTTGPVAIPREGLPVLLELLADPNRALPLIVCTRPTKGPEGEWLDIAENIAKRVEGVATVVTLDYPAVSVFKDAMGNLATWGGGVRVYAPEAVTPESDGWRHRYYVGSRLEAARQPTIDRIVYSVTQLSARRRVSDVFNIFDEPLGPSADATESKILLIDPAEAREQWEFDLELAQDERSELEKELAAATGHLSRLKDELVARNLVGLLWGTKHEAAASVPDEVQDTSEAVLAAQSYLAEWLALPESAVQELEDIDTAPTAFAWGNNTWRGLRALAAYAEDRSLGWSGGGFWEWCASGPPLGWPASSKKLSMTESESVQNNSKLARTRVFSVDPRVDESGKVTMLAHLKISEGGSNLAPRVYFYDDTQGPTKMVHVGLVGPHYLVPNKSTN